MKKLDVQVCSECGVPDYITSEHVWLDNGLIAQRRYEKHTAALTESDNLDPLFRGIEEIIGASIDHIILTARRRTDRAYLDRMISAEVKDLLRNKQLDLGLAVKPFLSIAQILGYGRSQLVDYRYELDDDDYAVLRIENPYSVFFGLGDSVAVWEVLTGYEGDCEIEEVSKDVYEVRYFRSSHSLELKDRLKMKTYSHVEGDIVLDRCATCGAPKGLSSYRWEADNGIILDRNTGRRIAFYAPAVLDAVLDELQEELGEAIPEAAIEAQRRFTKTGVYSPDEIKDQGELRAWLALRGLGNLKRFDMGNKGLSLRLDNAAMHLIMVGLFWGFYEMALGTESDAEWELSGEGNLEIEITPRS